jgi:hypothetical protein
MDVGIAPWEAWVRSTGLSAFILHHAWAWPLMETLHYFGLSLLLGTVGVFDLRVLGFAKGIPLAALHRVIPLGVFGFVLNLATGIGFFSGFPEQYFYNNAFRVKLALMAVAAVNIALFYTTAFKDLAAVPDRGEAPPRARLWTAISLSCWIGVLVCGRLLTFFRPPFFH